MNGFSSIRRGLGPHPARWALTLVAALCVAGAGGAETLAPAAPSAEQILAEIQKTRALRKEATVRLNEFRRAAGARERALRHELKRLRNSVDSPSAGPLPTPELSRTRAFLGERLRAVTLAALERLRGAAVTEDLESRTEGLQLVLHKLDKASGQSEDGASPLSAALAAYFEAMGRETATARRVSVRDEPVFLRGGTQRVHAYVLRLGHLGEVWLSEDGGTAGVGLGAGGTAERLTDEEVADRVRHAVNAARRKSTPAFLPTPVPIRVAGSVEENQP